MKAIPKTCGDCSHCKVSVKSTPENWLCFCTEAKKKTTHKEEYWFLKSVCRKFEDMGG
jgi:hypothetical protein